MFIDFDYEDIAGVEIPKENFAGIYRPKAIEQPLSVELLTEEALAEPIAFEPLDTVLKPLDKVLILSDDNTRNTPVDKVLDVLLPYLLGLGIRKENITILIALGTHRPMTTEELADKLGAKRISEYRVLNHEWDNEDQNIFYGTTSKGTEVWGNKLLKENDFVIGLGHIVPHRVAGFSGGGKIVQPGVATGLTTGETHWLSALSSGFEIMGKRDNPVRAEIDEAAELMGLHFIINVVQDSHGKTAGVFAGDMIEAHRAGCTLAKQVYGIVIPQAEIVIVDSYPADLELWQAAKGIYTSELAVKKDGIVILVTPCPEGVSVTHPEVEQFGYGTLEEIKKLVEQGKLKEKSVAAHLVHGGSVIKDRASGIMVCPNIPDAVKTKLGFAAASTVQEALDNALRRMGNQAKVVVIQHAGELLPISS